MSDYADRIPHEPVVRPEVLARNEKGRPTLVRHVCSVDVGGQECGRLVSNGRHASSEPVPPNVVVSEVIVPKPRDVTRGKA